MAVVKRGVKTGWKRCRKCGDMYPPSAFSFDRNGRIYGTCRECIKRARENGTGWQREMAHVERRNAAAALQGNCTCGCPHRGHAADGKGACVTCGELKCPSYFEAGL